MKSFICACGNRLFFENTGCLACGRVVGFDPASRMVVALDTTDDGRLVSASVPRRRTFRRCANARPPLHCNWLLPATSDADLCLSCRLTETIPDTSRYEAARRWARVESEKRRLLFTLLELRLPVVDRAENQWEGLGFAFLEDQDANPRVVDESVVTGHSHGLITVNLVEADDAERERIRHTLGERYRTLLGHLRHEAGHHYWRVLVEGTELAGPFRSLFGDESADYDTALSAYYASGGSDDWPESFVSRYAQSHPHEDWAETFALYLLLTDALETAVSFDIVSDPSGSSFDDALQQWLDLTVTLNEVNASLGVRDSVPFLVPAPVREKLRFIHSAVERRRGGRPGAPGTSV